MSTDCLKFIKKNREEEVKFERKRDVMGNEMGKCCASEEIEEVIKRDGNQTLDFDKPAEVQMTREERAAARVN